MIRGKIAWLEFEWESISDKRVEMESLFVQREPSTMARRYLEAAARLKGIEEALRRVENEPVIQWEERKT